MMNKTWKHKFYSLWFGQSISYLTSSIVQMALLWHLALETQSGLILSIATMAGFLPMAIIGLFSGTLVDRMNRKKVMILADLFIALCSLVLVIYGFFYALPIPLILLILFLRSVGTAFHSPAISAVTPLIVPEELLTKSAGAVESMQSMGYIIGVSIAALLYPILPLYSIILLDVIGAIIASCITLFIEIPNIIEKSTSKVKEDIKEGYAVLKEHKGLHTLTWMSGLYMVFYSPIIALFPLMTFQYFKGSTTDASILEIVFSIGMILGGFLIGIWGGFKKRSTTIIFSVFLLGSTTLLSGFLPSSGFILFIILCFFMGIAVPFYNAPITALLQERIPPQYLGRVFGIYGSILSFAMPIGLVFSALFSDTIGVANWFIICGGLISLLAVLIYFLPSIKTIEH